MYLVRQVTRYKLAIVMAVIKKSSVTSQISDYIRSKIESGEWKVGELIPSETVLTKELGVSRASLRTVISRFSALGILKPEQGKGCFLKTSDVRQHMENFSRLTHSDYIDISKLLSFRLMIEPNASEMCAGLDSEKHSELIAKLKESLEDMRESVDDRENFIKADLQFHKLLGFACGNELIGMALSDVFGATEKSAKDTNQIFGYEHGLKFHKRILEAIEKKDPKAAKKAMEQHLKDALEKISDK